MEIEQILSNAEIIEDSEESDEVTLGKWVVIKNLDTGEEHKFRIVTPQEADFFAQKLSSDSPLGKSLLGRKVGDVVKVKAPSGVQRYQVMAVMNK
jgi:transcription elongation factor GreA